MVFQVQLTEQAEKDLRGIYEYIAFRLLSPINAEKQLSRIEAGMLLKRRAREILTLADKVKQDFLCKAENLEGTITIGSGEFLSTGILTDCIAAFQKKFPRVRYEIFSGDVETIKDNIERGLLDMGLMVEPVDIRKYDFISMPIKEQWGALVREDSPLAAKEQISPRDLVGIPLISAVSDIVETKLGKWFGPVPKPIPGSATLPLKSPEKTRQTNGANP